MNVLVTVQFIHFLEPGHNLGPGAGNPLTDLTIAPFRSAAGAVKKTFGTARNRADTTGADQNTISAAFAFLGQVPGLSDAPRKVVFSAGITGNGSKASAKVWTPAPQASDRMASVPSGIF